MTVGLEVKCHSMFHMFLTLLLKALEAIKFNEPICCEIEVQHNQFSQCHIIQFAFHNPHAQRVLFKKCPSLGVEKIFLCYDDLNIIIYALLNFANTMYCDKG